VRRAPRDVGEQPRRSLVETAGADSRRISCAASRTVPGPIRWRKREHSPPCQSAGSRTVAGKRHPGLETTNGTRQSCPPVPSADPRMLLSPSDPIASSDSTLCVDHAARWRPG
jgi:hypothetical protein